jgi:tetratricopeptide (TPR) repeat protein
MTERELIKCAQRDVRKPQHACRGWPRRLVRAVSGLPDAMIRSRIGLRKPASGECRLNMEGLAADEAGNYPEAGAAWTQALKLREAQLAADDPDLAVSLNNLAELYWATGRYAEAEPLYQRAIKIDEKALGPEHPGYMVSRKIDR